MFKRLFKNSFYGITCSIIILAIFCFICLKGSNKTEALQILHNNTSTLKTPGNKAVLKNVSLTKENKWSKNKYIDKKCLKIYNKNQDLLVLANKDNPLPCSYSPSLQHICNGRLKASSYLYDNLVQMLSDAKTQGYSYWIASAYRSYKKQQSLVDEDINTFVSQGMPYGTAIKEVYKETMPAGCSEHQTGLALDILCPGNTSMDISQMDEPGNQWLRKNCYKYGFILRYPRNKSSITGINFEPWHFRYVGKEAAKYMTKNNITLEEFYQKLGINYKCA